MALVSNVRFCRVVDAERLTTEQVDAGEQRAALVRELTPTSRERLNAVEARIVRILSVYRAQQAEDYVVTETAQALERVGWVALKLLIARDHLADPTQTVDVSTLKRQAAVLDRELAGELAGSLRESKAATRELLTRRLEACERRAQALAEVEADLARTDAQLDLALDRAALAERPSAITAHLDLAGRMLDGSLFGDAENTVAAIERSFAPTPTPVTPTKETA